MKPASVHTGVGWFQADHIISGCCGFPFHKIWKIFCAVFDLQSQLQIRIYRKDPGSLILCLLDIVDKHILRLILFRPVHVVIICLVSGGSFVSWCHFFCRNIKLCRRGEEGITKVDVIKKHQRLFPECIIMISSLKSRLGKEIHVDSFVGKACHIQTLVTHHLILKTLVLHIKHPKSGASSFLTGYFADVCHLLHTSHILIQFFLIHKTLTSLKICMVLPERSHIQMPLLDDHLCKHISQKKHRLLKKRSHWLAGINLIFQIILRADRNPYHKIRNVFHLTVWIGTDMNDGAVHRCSGFSSDP